MPLDISFTAEEENSDVRIDRFLATAYSELSRSYIQKLIREGLVRVNDIPVKPSYIVECQDEIALSLPDNIMPDIEPENIPLDIVYQDEDIIIVYKPKGMVVHPANGNYSGTLVNALMYHFKDSLSGINGVLRPGIVHRIDKDTTGLLVVCRNDVAHRFVAEQLKEHSVTRKYEAICCGVIKEDELTIDAPIGRHPSERKKMAVNYKNGKNAVTHVRVLERFKGYTHIECVLETGRTHQIRVHLSNIGHPLLGDELYSGVRAGFKTQGQCLHAGVLGLETLHNGYKEFSYPVPEYFDAILKKLGAL